MTPPPGGDDVREDVPDPEPPDRPPLDSDTAIAELLDLLIGPADRRRRVLWLVLCAGTVPIQPCAVDLPPEGFPPEEDLRVYFAPFAEALQGVPDGALLVALSRPGSSAVQLADRRYAARRRPALRPARPRGLGGHPGR